MGEATRSENAGEGAPTSAVAFLIPTYKTPRLTADLLSAALACGKYDGCVFVLLLSLDDPNLLSYKTLVENVREKGLSAGYFIFDGTPYCGMINRVAPIVPASPAPLMPSAFVVEGTLCVSKEKNGKSSARGMV